MFSTIIQMLNGDRESPLGRESCAATDVIEKNSTEITVPVKFKSDIEALNVLYPEAFEKNTEIVMTLKDALSFLPRDRKRVDAYRSLADWMEKNMRVVLTIKSQKTK